MLYRHQVATVAQRGAGATDSKTVITESKVPVYFRRYR